MKQDMQPKKVSMIFKLRHVFVNNRMLVLMYVILILFGFIALGFGRYPISITELIGMLKNTQSGQLTNQQQTLQHILLNIRLPRIAAAVIIGSCLSAAGAALQGTFRNPMVSPGLLGVSSGAAFGAVLGILLKFNFMGIQLLSFIFGMGTIFLVYFIQSVVNKEALSNTTLILIGIVISSLFTSLISFLKYVADPYDTLPAITFWLMGSLSHIGKSELLPILIPVAIGLIILLIYRWQITIVSFGEEEATSIGLNYKRTRLLVVLASTLITASVVSISGLIGFVGLIVPHIARLIVGPNYTKLLPASIAIGGIYLLIIDTISRSLLTAEIPLGILTSIIGTPFFIILLINVQSDKH